MTARLLVHSGEDVGKSWIIEQEATIGRSAENRIRLKSKQISHRHARIFIDAKAGGYFLEDLGSSNGTVLAGSRVKKPERLLSLDVITLADNVELIFQVLPDPTAPAAAPAGGSILPG